MTDTFDAIVIGTGFGGAVAAARLADADYQVLLLERGRRYAPGEFPRPPLPQLYPEEKVLGSMLWGQDQGLWDPRLLGGMHVVQSAGVGGGSLVYANVHMRPPASAFDVQVAGTRQWPAAITRGNLDPYYNLAAYMLKVRPVADLDAFEKTRKMHDLAALLTRSPEFFRPNLAVYFGSAADADSGRPDPLDADDPDHPTVVGAVNDFGKFQGRCVGCGECVAGCQYGAKNTLDLNYLAKVEAAANARLKSLAEVRRLEPANRSHGGNLLAGIDVTYWDHLGATERTVWGRDIFLCAGAVNTTELLLRNRVRLGLAEGLAIGSKFFANADGVGVAFDTDNEHLADEGPTITTSLLHQRDADGLWMLLQDGGLPKPLLPWLMLLSVRFPERADFSSPGWLAADLDLQSALLNLIRLYSGSFDPPPGATGSTDLQDWLNEDLRALLPPALRELVEQLMDIETEQRLRERLTPKTREKLLPLVDAGIEEKIFSWFRKYAKGKARKIFDFIAEEEQWPQLRKALGYLAMEGGDELSKLLARDLDPKKRAIFLVMGRDLAGGQLSLGESAQPLLEATWNVPRNRSLYREQEQLMRDYEQAENADLRLNPAFELFKTPVTVHPQGGVPMGDVVDEWGALNGRPEIKVLDAAAFPFAVGANPSATIAALAERNIERHIRNRKADPTWVAPEKAAAQTAAAQHALDWLGSAGSMEPLDRVTATVPAGGTKPTNTQQIGIRFKERLGGYVSPVADLPTQDSEYQEAYRLGRLLGEEARVVARLDVEIPDLDAFLDSEDRRAFFLPTSELVFLGRQMTISQDRETTWLQIYVTIDGETQIFYQMDFTDDTVLPVVEYSLKAYKRIVDDPGPDAAVDLRTAFCTVFQRDAFDLAVDDTLQAGVVRQTYGDAAYLQLPSVEVIPPGISLERRVAAVASFTGFFFGNAIKIYGGGLQKVFGIGV